MEITIVGGGITGLTTAIALKQYGFNCSVYEQAKEINEIGAGIWLQPNAIKVLAHLNILDKINTEGSVLKRVEICNKDLKPIRKITRNIVQDKKGNQIIAIHRAKLQKILFKKASENSKIHLNSKYLNHTETNNKIDLEFENQRTKTSILLAADGIHSPIRQNVFSGSALRNSGQICWRGISKINLPPKFQNYGIEAWGNNVRFGISPISPNEVYWFAVGLKERHKNANSTSLKDHLLKLYKEFNPLVKRIIEYTDENKIHEALLFDLQRLDQWYKGNICLLGDAAHATTPNMGQGACQGIEDAYYISKYLNESPNASQAFKRFDRSRRKKVDYVVNNSWRFGKMAHSRTGRLIMNLIMKSTPEKVLIRQMNKLYEISELE